MKISDHVYNISAFTHKYLYLVRLTWSTTNHLRIWRSNKQRFTIWQNELSSTAAHLSYYTKNTQFFIIIARDEINCWKLRENCNVGWEEMSSYINHRDEKKLICWIEMRFLNAKCYLLGKILNDDDDVEWKWGDAFLLVGTLYIFISLLLFSIRFSNSLRSRSVIK